MDVRTFAILETLRFIFFYRQLYPLLEVPQYRLPDHKINLSQTRSLILKDQMAWFLKPQITDNLLRTNTPCPHIQLSLEATSHAYVPY